MKTKILALLLFVTLSINAQEAHVLVGQKAIEIGASFTNERELIFGFSLSGVDSKLSEKRANKDDIGKIHDFNDKYTPAVFGLIGGEFDELSVIGKLGAGYVNQSINSIPDSKKIYFAVGIMIDYEISSVVSLKSSFDSVNSIMAGIGIKIN